MLEIRFCFSSPKLWHLTSKWLLIDVFYELLDFPQVFLIKTCQNGKIWLRVSWLFQRKSISRKNQRMECVKRRTGTSALLVGIRIVTFYQGVPQMFVFSLNFFRNWFISLLERFWNIKLIKTHSANQNLILGCLKMFFKLEFLAFYTFLSLDLQ